MNIHEMLEANGFKRGRSGLYYSPFNVGERTPSLSVTPSGFGFKCWASGESGSIKKIADILGVENYMDKIDQGKRRMIEDKKPRTIYLSSTDDITDFKLQTYLKERQIYLSLHFFKQVVALDTKYNKRFTYLGIQNINDGWACRNKMKSMGKISLGKQGISVFDHMADKWVIAEGGFSGVSLMEIKLRKNREASLPNLIILNSVTNLKHAINFLGERGVNSDDVLLALDNDLPGDLATIEFVEGFGGTDIRKMYRGFKDANDFLMEKKIVGNGVRVARADGKYIMMRDDELKEIECSFNEMKKIVKKKD